MENNIKKENATENNLQNVKFTNNTKKEPIINLTDIKIGKLSDDVSSVKFGEPEYDICSLSRKEQCYEKFLNLENNKSHNKNINKEDSDDAN